MLNLTYEKGYENKRIVNPDSIDISKLTTDKDFIVAYAELSTASHFRDSSKRENEASEKAKQIVDQVRLRLERVGWHAHIFKTGSCECRCNQESYLHAAICGMPCVSEVSFSDERNIELTERELFNDDESLRERKRTLYELRRRIGKDILDIDKMFEEHEICEDVAETLKAIMEAQDLEELHELTQGYGGNYIMRCGSESWTWRDSESDAESEARESLEDDDYLWKQAVQADNTTLGFDDWVDHVLNMDGWAHILCGYDGCSYELDDGKVYWRTN